MKPSILIAGIGNIFLGDDAFGIEVVRTFLQRPVSPDVTVRQYGTRGYDLAYTLLDPWEAVILVDAMPRGDVPGTLYAVEPDIQAIGHPNVPTPLLVAHSIDPTRVLTLAASMGTITSRVLIIGCQPGVTASHTDIIGLTPPVQLAVEEACFMLNDIVHHLQSERRQNTRYAA